MKMFLESTAFIFQIFVQKSKLAEFTFSKRLFTWNSSVAVTAQVTGHS